MSKTITAQALHARLQSPNPPLVLEALPERYWRDRHLPGALLFPHDQARSLAAQVAPSRAAEIVVYCASRTCQNSHIAAKVLESLGYTDVAVFAGGKEEWQQLGYPFQSETAAAAA